MANRDGRSREYSRERSSPRSLVILGAGGHAVSVADAALASGWGPVCFISQDGAGPASALGPVHASPDSIKLDTKFLALGVGTNHLRQKGFDTFGKAFPKSEIVTVVHPTAWVSKYAVVNPGAVILANAVVGPEAVVGKGAVINTGASLDHGSVLCDYASLGPGTRTGGDVSVGIRAMIGLQASIAQGTRVGSDTVVGAHSFVKNHLGNNVVAWGVPAKPIRSRLWDEPYF